MREERLREAPGLRYETCRGCVPWLASQTDMLAEDWEIAEVRHG